MKCRCGAFFKGHSLLSNGERGSMCRPCRASVDAAISRWAASGKKVMAMDLAAELGISRDVLYTRIRRLGLQSYRWKKAG